METHFLIGTILFISEIYIIVWHLETWVIFWLVCLSTVVHLSLLLPSLCSIWSKSNTLRCCLFEKENQKLCLTAVTCLWVIWYTVERENLMTRMTAVHLTLTNVMKGVHSRHDICFSSNVRRQSIKIMSEGVSQTTLDYYTLFSWYSCLAITKISGTKQASWK